MRYGWAMAVVAAVMVMAGGSEILAAPPQQRIVRMSVTPAPLPQPAMRYYLIPSAAEQTEGNAATLFLMAMALGKPGGEEQSQASDLLDVPLSEVKAGQISEVLRKYSPTYLKYADMAARRNRCDWDLTLRSEGYYALLPQLNPMREMATAVALDARLCIVKRDYDGAVGRMQTGYAMVRDLNRQTTLVQALVGAGIGHLVSMRVEEFIGSPGSPNLYWALANLPRPLLDAHEAFQYERYMMEFTFPQVKKMRDGTVTVEEFREFLTALNVLARADSASGQLVNALRLAAMYPRAKRQLIEDGLTAAQVDAMPAHRVLSKYLVERYDRCWEDIIKWAGLPYWQAADGMRRAESQLEREKAGGDVPMLSLIPSCEAAYLRVVLLDRRIASLMCVEAVRAYAATHKGALPASLEGMADTPAPMDPLTGKPFSYRVEGGKAVIDAPAPSGENAGLGWRYEISVSR